jgi:6,7-dimethyl-8-ribityllumazine synthase
MSKENIPKIAIVVSRYRAEVGDSLLKHCLKTLEAKGIAKEQLKVVHVPGALEIPLAAKKLARSGRYQAIIVFGSVLKGKTYHFEQVADECVRGCMRVSYDFELPVIFEVLCVYDLKDAMARAAGKIDNRGVEGALSALAAIEDLSDL